MKSILFGILFCLIVFSVDCNARKHRRIYNERQSDIDLERRIMESLNGLILFL